MNKELQSEPADKIFQMVQMVTPKDWRTLTFVFEPLPDGKQRFHYDGYLDLIFLLEFITGMMRQRDQELMRQKQNNA